jgi:hypothetical protein
MPRPVCLFADSFGEVQMAQGYQEPVAKLLNFGVYKANDWDREWPDYLTLGLAEDQVPDLIRMATDMSLHQSSADSPEVWAPVHAWRALGQLRAEAAAEPLVKLFEDIEIDDWLNRELPKVLSMIGPATVPTLENFLAGGGQDDLSRISIPGCLGAIAQDHPVAHDDCIRVLVGQLKSYESNDETLNAFLILSLVELGATETIGTIREAFADDRVDLAVMGDVEDVEIEMGLRTTRSTPPPPNPFHQLLGYDPIEALAEEMPGYEDLPYEDIPIRRPVKIGRNEPCPCGSGKKYKKCCLP